VTVERNRKYRNVVQSKFTRATEKSTGKVRRTLGRDDLTKSLKK
jgi:hypothetical protein